MALLSVVPRTPDSACASSCLSIKALAGFHGAILSRLTASISTCVVNRKDSIPRGTQSGKASRLNRFRQLSRLMAVCLCRKCSAVVCDTSPTALSWAVRRSLTPYSTATARNSGTTANPARVPCALVTGPTFALCVTCAFCRFPSPDFSTLSEIHLLRQLRSVAHCPPFPAYSRQTDAYPPKNALCTSFL